jgi:hypothetical protein
MAMICGQPGMASPAAAIDPVSPSDSLISPEECPLQS